MKKTETIIARYIELSRAVTATEKAKSSSTVKRIENLDKEQEALDKFWAFVDKYLYDLPISEVRKADNENNLKFTAFC